MPVKGLSGIPADIRLDTLPDPGNRFTLGKVIGTGVSATVYEAVDSQYDGKKVAIKIQKVLPEYENDIKEEYKILKYLASHPNLPTFLGGFHKKGEVWFALELCEGGPVIELVRALYAQNRHLSEEQVAFILKETVKAICHLHENHVLHRDLKAKNILLTATGEIKIVDFGLSRGLKNTLDKRNTCLGSPCWMAPELIISGRNNADGVTSYDNRIDVWALGITALELAEGQAPYEDMHPTRAIFQIVRNPPPTFRLPSKWSQYYADFIAECLVKLPEERPFIFEFLEHPFLKSVVDKSTIGLELVSLKQKLHKVSTDTLERPEVHLRNGRLQRKVSEATEAMIVEDLAAVDDVTEKKIMNVLQERFKRGLYYTYIADMLVFVNPNIPLEIYGTKYHMKYQWKSRSDNSPHIYAVGDCAYQDMLHHKEPQNIILTGETLSGKTTNYNHLLDHLLYLGKISNKISDKIEAASKIIQTLGNASSPHNNNSTRHVINTQVTYTSTGKLSGAIFYLYQLEKWRVTGFKNPLQGNFHIFYYFYDYLRSQDTLKKYYLENTNYQYLNRKPVGSATDTNFGGATNELSKNAKVYTEILHLLEVLEFEPDQIEIVQKIIAAIILIGELRFKEAGEAGSEVENMDVSNNIATLLEVDEKKFAWALCNYCVIQKGTATRKKQSVAQAVESQRVLARGLYARLVDFIVNVINLRLSVTRVVLGDKFYISILDLPGFEVLEQNNMEQLFINSTNEQMQYFYNQRVFIWELGEQEEGIILKPLQFYDNKPTIDELLSKPDGFMYVIDEASRSNSGYSFIIDALANCPRGTRIRKATSTNFTIAHYCKKVEYNVQDIPEKNHDFLPPEMIETLRNSGNFVLKQLFTNQFTKSGNLTISAEQNVAIFSGKRKKWGAALVSGDQKSRKFNTEVHGEYSQTRRMRTCASVYRASSLEILKSLSESNGNNNFCFVRCIKAGLPTSNDFEADIVSPQLRSLSVLDTTRARQIGYSYCVSFKDFIERYKFLAFDFDENVDITRENCRLLLIRLKMEGWIIGKNKVFLRYYDKEYLSRLYETHVKKIIKIQAVMRKFITKRKVIPRVQSQQSIVVRTIYSKAKIRGKCAEPDLKELSKEDVVIKTQNGVVEIRKTCPIPITSEPVRRRASKLAQKYAHKWRSKTIFQILLMYRAKMFQEFSSFSQQVHLYNQHAVHIMTSYKRCAAAKVDAINKDATYEEFIGKPSQVIFRIPFNLKHRSSYNTDLTFDPYAPKWKLYKENEDWDAPLKSGRFQNTRQRFITQHIVNVTDTGIQANLLEKEKNEEENVEIIYCDSQNSTVDTRYMGSHLKRNISVYSIESENDRMSKKGEFMEEEEETVGKRESIRKSQTKSIASSVCSIAEENEKELDFENSIKESVEVATEKKMSPVLEQFSIVSAEVDSPETEKPTNRRILRSVSLTETINDALCKELTQSIDSDGSIKWTNKLRKTSYTAGDTDSNKLKEDTVIELKIRGKEHVEIVKQNNENEPPFNFQSILRKTNNRPSLKRINGETGKEDKDETQEKYSLPRKTSLISSKVDNYFSQELLPGIILKGVAYDL